jgi:DNA-binding NarL/FixJ family response regulator
MTGRYQEAFEANGQQLEEAEQYRLAFVLPLSYVRRALALRGLRRFREALECLGEAQLNRETKDDHVAISAATARIGIHVAMGDLDEAFKVSEPSSPASAAANAIAELIATRALAFACAARLEEARDGAQRAELLSSAAEPRLIAKFARLITAVQETPESTEDLIRDVLDDVSRSANVDVLVTAYRGFPQLLTEIVRIADFDARLAPILVASGDSKLARVVFPQQTSPAPSKDSLLTTRERDIFAMVSQGLRNREIAEQLFISEVTVKTHVRNIMKKLGAHSRTHAVSLMNRED